MNWITQDAAFMGYIRECEGEEDVDTRDAKINRMIKYLADNRNNEDYTIDYAMVDAGFTLWDELAQEELDYIRKEVRRRGN